MVGEEILQNMGFRHKKYNKTETCYERTTNESINHPVLPQGSNTPQRSVHKAWNNPKSLGNAGIFLKTRTLAHPLNP